MKKLLVVVFLFAVACSSKGTPSATTEASGPPSTAAPTPTATPCSVQGASTLDATSTSSGSSSPVTDLRYSDDGCPSIVFEFKNDVPGYKIGYAAGPFSDCGSGQKVATESWGGDNYLQIKLTPSGGADLAGNGEATYKGSRDIAVDKPTLKHLKVTCDFEADFTWLAGLSGKHPFKVTKLDNPARLQISISETTT